MSRALRISSAVVLACLAVTGPAEADVTIHVVGRLVFENPRGELVGADGLRVQLHEEANGLDLCLNSILGGTVTGEDGYFDFTVVYSPGVFCADPEPDVRLKVVSPTMQTAMVPNFPGGTLDFGVVRAPSSEINNRLFLGTMRTRVERWFREHGTPSYDAAGLSIQSPLAPDPRSHYIPFGELGSVSQEHRWNELVIVRVLAEGWIDTYATYWSMDAANGVCDDAANRVGPYPETAAGYCFWCPESQVIAWHIGFSEWVADEVVRELPSRYGYTPLATRDIERIQGCSETTQTQWETPGLFAAVLRDISDATNENDTAHPEGWDALATGPTTIVSLFATEGMSTPGMFFDAFRAVYPELCTELSLTALNNGYIIDTTPPAPVTDLASPSHAVGVPSTDATVDLTWTKPADDCETASRFSIRWGSSPALPDEFAEAGNVSAFTIPILAPGTYYITIRAGDAVGNWSTGYDTVGPIIIAPPGPANLEHVAHAGWTNLVTPRPAGNASSGNVPVPTSLTGNAAATWWNATVGNTGGATAASTGLWVQADGIGFYNPLFPVDHAAAVPSLAVGAGYEALNLGPITVRGGRHTFGAYNDFTGLVAESNENDNYWATQWIWSPYLLPSLGSTFRIAPPARMGGFDGSISTTWFNCDGIRMQANGSGAEWWNAVTLVANAHDADYDLRLHTASTGPTSGFGTNAGYSGRPADCLDAVLVNKNLAGDSFWDVGVVQATDTPSLAGYDARHVTSTLETFNATRAFTLGANEWMSLHEVFLAGSDLGPVSFVVRNTSGSGLPFHISWFDVPFETGGMDDYTATAVSNAYGEARLDITATFDTYSCLMVYRDPKDGPADPQDFTITIERTPPDLAPGALAGWDGPLVARPAADGTGGSVPAPTMLPGWATSTWLNLLVFNIGPTEATGPFDVDLDLDGVLIEPLVSPTIPAFNGVVANNLGPYTVRGGRHTAAMRIDWPDAVHEISELNNSTARQWAWSPQTLPMGPTTGLPVPGDPLGSWEHLDWSDPSVIWSNSDGYRTPVFDPGGADGLWGGVAIMPGASTDVTLRLHGILDDVDLSFGEPLTLSDFPTGEIDFSLIDFTYWNPGAFDVGVSGGYGTENFTAEVVSSTYLASNPSGSYGTFNLGANEMLNLHEVDLPAGYYQIRLENLSSADLGFSLHPHSVGVMSRVDAIPDGASWLQVAGEDEQMVIEIPSTGLYCIAVWKVGAPSLSLTADYNIVFNSVTAANDVPVTATSLMGAYPNPFEARTAVAFDLEEPGPVALDVFDLRGSRVRSLVGETQGAGHHEVTWDGLDGAGRPVASGIYLVRLVAGGAKQVTRLTLVR